LGLQTCYAPPAYPTSAAASFSFGPGDTTGYAGLTGYGGESTTQQATVQTPA